LEFVVKRLVTPTGALPTALPAIPPLASPVVTRDFAFNGANAINGITFDMNRVDFQVPFGQVERWRFSTTSNAPHPIHTHGAMFQVQSRSGGRGSVFPWERGWKDTVLLQDAETVEVLVRFDQYRGIYLLHCHRLDHEDGGMMLNFEVV
jgi:blue copper oxidase